MRASKAMADRVTANSKITVHYSTAVEDAEGNGVLAALNLVNTQVRLLLGYSRAALSIVCNIASVETADTPSPTRSTARVQGVETCKHVQLHSTPVQTKLLHGTSPLPC
jgi:thioredoxin reductase